MGGAESVHAKKSISLDYTDVVFVVANGDPSRVYYRKNLAVSGCDII